MLLFAVVLFLSEAFFSPFAIEYRYVGARSGSASWKTGGGSWNLSHCALLVLQESLRAGMDQRQVIERNLVIIFEQEGFFTVFIPFSEEIFADKVPECTVCSGVVKPDIVFFRESLPTRFFDLMTTDFKRCDLLIIMGTSLTVQPFASLVDKWGPLFWGLLKIPIPSHPVFSVKTDPTIQGTSI